MNFGARSNTHQQLTKTYFYVEFLELSELVSEAKGTLIE